MSSKRTQKLAAVLYAVLLTAALGVLAWFSLQDRLVPFSYTEPVRQVTAMTYQAGNNGGPISLPAKLTNLPPGTPVTLSAEIEASPHESLLLKSVFTPVRLYFDEVLIYECGWKGSYPPYMNDPPTIITTVPLPDKDGAINLRIEYLSPTQRGVLSLPALYTGNETALFVKLFYEDGFSLLFSLLLIFIGIIMIMVSLAFIRKIPEGSSFLWLGLFSLSSGVWVFGECDLTAFLLPYPSLLHTMAYTGLFILTIPFLRFGLVILNPRNKLPLRVMLYVHYISVAAAFTLQFSGAVDFIKSLYWFHIIAPLGFIVFAVCLIWEYLRYHNSAAKRFAPAIILLTASTILEVLSYWLHPAGILTAFFQIGVLAFVFALGIASGYYVRESVYTAAEKTRLEYEMTAIGRQLELQRLQYRKMAENDAAVKAQRHDLRHQLTVIAELNERGNTQKLRAYIDELTNKIPPDKGISLCENYAVNAVATYYYSIAQSKGIDISIMLAIAEDNGCVQDSDLCIIVGNLLENAIEACERIKEGKRFIKMNSRLKYNTLTITADNSFDGNYETEDSLFLSAKRDGKGTGLSSILAVAQKYGGAAKFEPGGNVFLSSVYIKLNNNDTDSRHCADSLPVNPL